MNRRCQLPCQWVYPVVDEKLVAQFIKEFMIHPITAQILAARGFRSCSLVHDYLYAQLPDLHSPHLLTDMDKATQRIHKAIRKSEKILVYGDNDVDGITATALLVDFLRRIGAQTHFFISSRHQLTAHSVLTDALDFAKKRECTLVITVDCGITAAQEVKAFAEHKIDVIVTDHHCPTAKIPHCVATLNPKLINDNYPNKELTGVGVAFKLAHALMNQLVSSGNISHHIDLKEYLDLVALGTIADMGSLLGENRILVRYGIKQLRSTRRLGLRQLFAICGLRIQEATSNDIVLKVAPRINSLGRIADPTKGVELLLAKDALTAETLASELDLNNRARQELEQEMVDHLEKLLEKNPSHLSQRGIVIASDEWHTGIVPLLSTRISRKYNRPCAMIAIEGGLGKGSLRSIRELPILSMLKEFSHLFVNFGGHDYAAGITIPVENIEEFRLRFHQMANRSLSDRDIAPKIQLDAALLFRDINFDLIESLELLEPYGQDNPPPLFYTEANQIWLPKLFKRNHIKMFLEQNDIILEGMGFNMAEMRHSLMKKHLSLKIAFTPQIFNAPESSRMQLIIREFISIGS